MFQELISMNVGFTDENIKGLSEEDVRQILISALRSESPELEEEDLKVFETLTEFADCLSDGVDVQRFINEFKGEESSPKPQKSSKPKAKKASSRKKKTTTPKAKSTVVEEEGEEEVPTESKPKAKASKKKTTTRKKATSKVEDAKKSAKEEKAPVRAKTKKFLPKVDDHSPAQAFLDLFQDEERFKINVLARGFTIFYKAGRPRAFCSVDNMKFDKDGNLVTSLYFNPFKGEEEAKKYLREEYHEGIHHHSLNLMYLKNLDIPETVEILEDIWEDLERKVKTTDKKIKERAERLEKSAEKVEEPKKPKAKPKATRSRKTTSEPKDEEPKVTKPRRRKKKSQ